MGSDHMPNNVMDVLESLAPDYPEAIISDNGQSDRHQQVAETC